MTKLKSPGNRGLRSVLWDVKRPKDKTCRLKRHFIGCLRQVVGLAEKLADNDPERFIWITQKGFMAHARKRTSGMYSNRQVRYSIGVAKQIGILTPTERKRNGVKRKGYIVREHDLMTVSQGSRCVLSCDVLTLSGVDPDTIADAKSASGDHATAMLSSASENKSATPSAQERGHNCTPECLNNCQSKVAEVLDFQGDAKRKLSHKDQIGQQKRPLEPSHPSQVNPYSPIQQNPLRMTTTTKQNRASHDLDDCDLSDSTNRLYAKTDKTIGMHFEFREWKLESVINRVSDGEFKTEYLKQYRNASNLLDSCSMAIQELADEPFVGRTSCAQVMGLTMEILRRDYDQDAPKGWVPVMKILRATPDQPSAMLAKKVSEGSPDDVFASSQLDAEIALYEIEKRQQWVRESCDPYTIFSDGISVLVFARPTIMSDIASMPHIKAAFLWVAARRGLSPTGIPDAIPYVEDVIRELTLQGHIVPTAVTELHQRLVELATECKHANRRSTAGLDLRFKRDSGVVVVDPHTSEPLFLDKDVNEHREQQYCNPENILSPYSALYAADFVSAVQLSEQPEIRTMFVALAAEQKRVPGSYQKGLEFMELMLGGITAANGTVPEPAKVIYQRLQEINQRILNSPRWPDRATGDVNKEIAGSLVC
jgi:hypothetical protein